MNVFCLRRDTGKPQIPIEYYAFSKAIGATIPNGKPNLIYWNASSAHSSPTALSLNSFFSSSIDFSPKNQKIVYHPSSTDDSCILYLPITA
jgi:hypothetical protein